MKKIITLSLLISLILTSCYTNRVTVGYGPVGESISNRTFSKMKQRYILFGLIRLNHENPKMPPANVGFELKSGFSFVDGVLTLITVGIYGQRTVKILVGKEVEQDLKLQMPNQKLKP